MAVKVTVTFEIKKHFKESISPKNGLPIKPCVLKKPSHVQRMAWLVPLAYAAGFHQYILIFGQKNLISTSF
jgi:hypothetical protein